MRILFTPKEVFWTTSKVISGLIVLTYVVLAALYLGPADALEVLASALAPILCIWCPEIMAEYEGWGVLHGRPITGTSPPGCVYVLGWLLLLLPVVQIVVMLAEVARLKSS